MAGREGGKEKKKEGLKEGGRGTDRNTGSKKTFVCNLPRVGRISVNDPFGIVRNRNCHNGSV